MSDKDHIRLKHMLDSANAIQTFIIGKTKNDLKSDRLLSSAVMRELEIIGEAASAITENTKDKYSPMPWKQIVGMRNRLIHAYFDVDHDIVWETKVELPQLISRLEEILS